MNKKISINQLKRILRESAGADSNMKEKVIKDVIAKFNSLNPDFLVDDLVEALATVAVNKFVDIISGIPSNGTDINENKGVQLSLSTLAAFISNIVSDVVKNDDEYSAALDYHQVETPDTYD